MDDQTKAFIEAAKRCMAANKSFNKVFCIGAHKTGTTSMQAVFQVMGLDVAPQHEGELYALQASRGDYSQLRAYVDRHDAFQDSPFADNMVFTAMDALFPDSRFILTVREPEEWYRSLTSFHAKIFGVASSDAISKDMMERASYLYPGYIARGTEHLFLASEPDYTSMPTARTRQYHWDLLYNKDHYIASYLARNETIRRYFREHDHKLLEIDVTRETTTAKIVEFLGMPAWMAINMPKMNQTN